ncbi:uncharacterized protein MYCGRDRAFT_43643 [Zymoseptoria tritici IPO323]|uniref:Zn(2)-C6 fungal-type domain-containing protein n=2 Tax=Zymoseptoria tritici TaxID=1047171 RepID=F9XEG3_ZYMTI|nr:uncharacterized protein MYCGRDRAFT_43643 [Zymoseptoria tritici IPO323]EGP86337.1 hypothetical protein MYCGRDRAFT_43643 [Zymoseptoria tritici IPO323]
MPPLRTDRDKPRQDPVSCQVCRQKKLKCDRKLPCSNCRSRKVTCEYQNREGDRQVTVDNGEDDGRDDLRAENRAMRARLDRLEQVVFQTSAQTITPLLNGTPTATLRAVTTPAEHRSRTDATRADEDSHLLESVGAHGDVVLPPYAARIAIHLQDLQQSLTPHLWSEVRNISIPTAEVAYVFLDAYAIHLDSLQHLLHIESTRRLFARTYDRIRRGQEVDAGALCLILAICASVAYYYTEGSSSGNEIFDSVDTAYSLAVHWAKQGLYAMEQIQIATTSEPTLEAVQSLVMLAFVFYHMEGFTYRVRCMHPQALHMARSLGMNTMDHGGGQPQPYDQDDVIDREVRRKVWWHLTSTDWILAFMGGSQGDPSYSTRPENMKVNLPRNLNQQDLESQDGHFTRPAEEPTGMAYYLQRIKLAAICREVFETLWQPMRFGDPADFDYNIVSVLDAMFENQLSDLPRFMRLDIPDAQLRAEYGVLFTPALDLQRLIIHLMNHSRRCRIHMPFLIRAKNDPRFQSSRRKGLQSARAVVEIRRLAMSDKESGVAPLKLGGVLQHIFYATIALVMDLCVNRDDEGASLAEVREVLRIVANTRTSSPMARRFHESLTETLRKHNVVLPDVAAPTNSASVNGTATLPLDYAADVAPSIDLGGDELWEQFLNTTAPAWSAQDWDSLLFDIDMQSM